MFIYQKYKKKFLCFKCKKARPYGVHHELYYDGYKKEYNYGFLVGVDCDGWGRIFHGHQPGSLNDLESWYLSDMCNNYANYFGVGDKSLADGIFSRIAPGSFITPICYVNRDLSVAETRFNELQSWDRSIIEHYFARAKNTFSMINNFELDEDAINYVFITTLILNNIIIRY